MSNKVDANMPSEEELVALKYFMRLLRPLKDITYDLSGSKYVTASMVYPAIYTLVNHELVNVFASNELSRVPPEIKIIQSKLINSLKSRFGFLLNNTENPEMENTFLALSFLDCRFKSFNFISDLDEREKKLQLAKEFLLSLHENLKKSTASSTQNDDDAMSGAQIAQNSNDQTNILANATNKKKNDRPSFLKSIVDSRFVARSQLDSVQGINLEIKEYEHDISFLSRSEEERNELMYNPLEFYRIYSTKYPLISNLARQLLSVTGTSVPSECLFSHVGLIASKLRSRLSPMLLESLVFIKDNNNN
jgi:hypothetical protein